LKAIIEVYKALYPKEKIKLAAPTGRASRRMAESTGETDASTLHSMLGLFSIMLSVSAPKRFIISSAVFSPIPFTRQEDR
jgi:hypothetical protein